MGVSEYSAVVRELKGARVELELARGDLPLSFRAKSVLSPKSSSSVMVEVDRLGRDLKVGEQVAVLLEERIRMGWVIFWLSVVPVIILGIMYALFDSLLKDAKIAMVGAGFFVFPYYSFLWLLRHDWSRVFIFRLQ